jgi:hypothetical protein
MAEVNLAGGTVQMDTGATAAAMDLLAAAGGVAGTSLRVRWDGQRSLIDGLAGQLGNGPLGTAFAEPYRETEASLYDAADRICEALRQLADNGRACVGSYLRADAESRQAISEA